MPDEQLSFHFPETVRVVPNAWNPSFHLIEGQHRAFMYGNSPTFFPSISAAVEFARTHGVEPVIDITCARWADQAA